jgi:hypothetical protein
VVAEHQSAEDERDDQAREQRLHNRQRRSGKGNCVHRPTENGDCTPCEPPPALYEPDEQTWRECHADWFMSRRLRLQQQADVVEH